MNRITRKIVTTVGAVGLIGGAALSTAGSAQAVTLDPFCKNFTSFTNQQQACQNAVNYAQAARTSLSPMTARGIVTQEQYYCNDRAAGYTHDAALNRVKNRIGGVIQRAQAIGFGANSVSCRIF